MLTKSHYTACRVTNRQERAVYRQHMCGLCHALGDDYGLASRLLTNHDMILLNLLASAQRPESPETILRRCPLNPRVKVATNRDSSSAFAAAAAVELAVISADDHVQDSGGHNLGARVGGWLLRRPHRAAMRILEKSGFDITALIQLSRNQDAAERDSAQDPASPTAKTSAALFIMTGRLAGLTENEESLAEIGAQYGTFLYLADAYHDFAHDMANGDFNPLRSFGRIEENHVVLSRAGLTWLVNRLRAIHNTIQIHVARLHLYRHRAVVTRLLTEPVTALIDRLERVLDDEHAPAYRQWTLADVVKAAFFIMPAPVADTGLAGLYAIEGDSGGAGGDAGDEGFHEKPKRGKRKRRKRSTTGSQSTCDQMANSDCLYACYCLDCTDCGDLRECSDNDGCGVPDCDADNNCIPDSCEGGDCGGIDCTPDGCDGADCGDMDCGGADCGGADCGGVDCS